LFKRRRTAQWLLQAEASTVVRLSNEEGREMLKLKPSCECCDRDLPPESLEARICSFECTFCATCAEDELAGICPNCGGELVRRPIRPPVALARFPASTERHVNQSGCEAAAARRVK
jgi:uncharacterized protein